MAADETDLMIPLGRPDAHTELERDEAVAAVWCAFWLGAAVLAGLLLAALDLLTLGRGTAALTIGAAPALWSLMLASAPRHIWLQASVVLVWALGGALASLLTGGVGGPLAAWCLGPLAAAIFTKEPRLLALGGALTIAAAALSGLGAATLHLRPPSPELAAGLGLLALTTTGGGFAAGLAILIRSTVREPRAGDLEARLAGAGLLLLDLTADGVVQAAYGQVADGIAPLAHGIPFVGMAEAAKRQLLNAAVAAAAADGQAEVAFAPAAAPDRWLAAHLRRRPNGGLAVVLQDGASQRAYERDLERARDLAESQNAGKSRFLANMSHELRTPLNAIMGFSDIMRQRLFGPLSDRYGEYAELVHESGAHLLELINDILDMSKIEAERFELSREQFDARDAVSAVLRLMRGQADRAGVQLRGVLPREPLTVDADRRALKQIALNLISNALKFTLKDGAITVTAQAADGAFELVVADTGVGISEEDLARLGNPYEQAGGAEQRAAGTGLGLALVRAFARLHGGEMSMESRLGEGTTVSVRLPVLVAEKSVA